MPALPPGEGQLRELGSAFARAEGKLLVWIGEAAIGGDRRYWTQESLKELVALRRLDFKAPVITAYLAEHASGQPDAVNDLAGSLALKLDRGTQQAADAVRYAFGKVTQENIVKMTEKAAIAHVDRRGAEWGLGSWAMMNTATLGRQSTSRGVSDRVGKGGKVTVDIGECSYCEDLFSGELIVGQDPLPPGHPNCSCVAG